MAADFDVVVLGGGPVGENVAQYATEDSPLKAAVVERELMGGECSYYACMPSKALLRPVQVAESAARLGGLTRPELDVTALLQRRDTWVSGYDDSGQVEWARSAGLEVVRGAGRLAGERVVEVAVGQGSRTLTAAKAVVIATGSEAVVPDEFAAAHPWTSRDATGVREVPERLAVVGGGVVALEAATWMAAMGSRVTLLVRGESLLGSFEPFAGEAVGRALTAAGVDVRLSTGVTAVKRPGARDTGLGKVHGGPVTLTTSAGELEVDEVLVATGRRPRLDDLGLETVGLSPQNVLAGRLPSWLYVVGDASGEAPLTHWGKYRARVVVERIADRAAGRQVAAVPPTVPVPQVVFTDPEVASVGLTEAQARDKGVQVDVAQVPYNAAVGTALLRDEVPGTAQLVVDANRKVLIGATFVGPDAAELAHGATIAIAGEVPVWTLRHAVPSYPTGSELWLRLLESLPRAYRRP